MDAERTARQRLRELRKEIARDATELQIRWHEVKRSAASEWGGVASAVREFARLLAPGRGVRAAHAREADGNGAVPGRSGGSTRG